MLKPTKKQALKLVESRMMPRKIVHENGCWTLPLLPRDHGYIYVHARPFCLGAHVISFIAFLGRLKNGYHVLHKCDNRACWNPDHLFTGTQADNMKDKQNKGRAIGPHFYGVDNPACKLSEDLVRQIRSASGMNKDIAVFFGISKSLVSAIKRREVWKQVD